MAWHLESDGWHASRVALLALAEQCRSDGVKVLLTGEGADELFGGYDWQKASMRRWRAMSWPRSLLRSKRSFARRLENGRQAPFDLALGKASPFERNTILRALSPELNFLQTRIFDRLEPIEPLTDRAFLGSCIYGLYSHLQDLLHRHDRLSMASSVELRVPFIENSIIDFAIHLPMRFKYRGKSGKWLLKKVAERYLPRENVHARKIGFGISEKLSQGGEGLLRDGLLRDAMRWPSESVNDLVDLAARDETSRIRLVGMELFLRLYAGGESVGCLSEKLKALGASRTKG